VSYNKTFNEQHRVDLVGVFSMQQNQGENLYGLGNGLSYNSLWYNLQGGSVTNRSTSSFSKTSLMSYLARVNYVFKDRYLATVSYRQDGSSKLAPGHKWGGFPSAAVAWRISQEEFMKPLSFIDNLKLRLSYGQTGNDNVSAYATEGSISGSQYYSFGSSNQIGNFPNNLRNLDLGWERTTEYNVGLDFGILGGRLSGSIEYYNRLTEELIMNKTVPVTTGYSSVRANVGSVRNTGVEVYLNSVNIDSGDFTWKTTLNFANNKNRIVDLQYIEDLTSRGLSMAGMEGDYSNLWVVGMPVDVNYNLVITGVWQLDEAEEAAKYAARPGQFKALDLNDDGKIDDQDRVFDGQRTPTWTGGMTNTFSYKGFDLSFQLAFQTGGRMRNAFYVSYATEGNAQNFNNLRRNYWTPENPSNEAAQPSNQGSFIGKAGSWGNGKSESTKRYASSDYLKMSYITLGYNLPQAWNRRMGVGNLRLYATVQNPFIWTGRDVVDPEQLSTGINTTDYITNNFIFGLNVTF
jgi:TonB-linked SusC/RagA family outer membrane protein